MEWSSASLYGLDPHQQNVQHHHRLPVQSVPDYHRMSQHARQLPVKQAIPQPRQASFNQEQNRLDEEEVMNQVKVEDGEEPEKNQFQQLTGHESLPSRQTRAQSQQNQTASDRTNKRLKSQPSLEGAVSDSAPVACVTCGQEFVLVSNLRRQHRPSRGDPIQCKRCRKKARPNVSSAKTSEAVAALPTSSQDDQSITSIWDHYRAFEEFSYNGKDDDLEKFMVAWQERMCLALSAGCCYSDPVLAFKLLEKVNLEPNVVSTIVGSLTYPGNGESLLTQTVTKIQALLSAVKDEPDERTKTQDQPNDLQSSNNDLDLLDMIDSNDAGEESVLVKSEVNSAKTYKCDDCGTKFRHESRYEYHKRTAHLTDRELDSYKDSSGFYQCDSCPEKFSGQMDFMVHQREHRGEPLFQCEVCGKSFLYESLLKTHSKTHSQERNFPCPICTNSFKHKVALKVHMRRHTGEKPYVCDDCGKSFTQHTTWRDHKRRHTGEKPFQCEDCGQTFAHSSGYRCHRRIHTGEKPYKCEHCGHAFRQPGGLIEHLKTHTGEKPYPCEVCGRAFSNTTIRKRHLKTHRSQDRQQERPDRYLPNSSDLMNL